MSRRRCCGGCCGSGAALHTEGTDGARRRLLCCACRFSLVRRSAPPVVPVRVRHSSHGVACAVSVAGALPLQRGDACQQRGRTQGSSDRRDHTPHAESLDNTTTSTQGGVRPSCTRHSDHAGSGREGQRSQRAPTQHHCYPRDCACGRSRKSGIVLSSSPCTIDTPCFQTECTVAAASCLASHS